MVGGLRALLPKMLKTPLSVRLIVICELWQPDRLIDRQQ